MIMMMMMLIAMTVTDDTVKLMTVYYELSSVGGVVLMT